MVLSNNFKTWSVIELKKLLIHDSIIKLRIKPRLINDVINL